MDYGGMVIGNRESGIGNRERGLRFAFLDDNYLDMIGSTHWHGERIVIDYMTGGFLAIVGLGCFGVGVGSIRRGKIWKWSQSEPPPHGRWVWRRNEPGLFWLLAAPLTGVGALLMLAAGYFAIVRPMTG